MNTITIPTKYVFTFILSAALVVFGCSVLFGWNNFVDKLGGAKSFAALVALIIMGAIIIGGIVYLQLRDYENQMPALIRDATIAALVVFILAGIGFSWLSLPNGAGMKVLACLAAIAVASGAVLWIDRRPEA